MPCKHLADCVKYTEMTLDPSAADCYGCSTYEEEEAKKNG